ncbi:AraC family transcriptional regulator [Enterococcus faecalis]|uniref:helix-turn-helix transcriptional regulator n=1 Tax=Enterococcus faecalis TaxID=1351 RepID=UPI001C8B5C6F|nr:AraC family transcriptional regulator [Enterococcus faecalis]EJJ0922449.1 AraC family transcriptional regulator [Enterococcus faecalis]MBX8940062.1 AraC family transcriptional regulator [Enterococcus faecalis]
MNYTNSRTFNPEILYAFDPWNEETHPYNCHHHEFLEISILLEGESEYIVQGQQYHATTGTVFLFNPRTEHGEQQKAGTYSHQLHIGISNLYLEGLARNVFPNKSALLDLSHLHGAFLEKAWQIVHELNHQEVESALQIKALVIELLVYILRSLAVDQENKIETRLSKTEKRKRNLVNHTIYYLETHHDEEITLEQLAEMLYVTPTYLSKTFKAATGVGPINYLIQIRLNHAKELLKNDSLSVKEVAKTVGYEDAYHFSKLFKKYYGKSPSQF